MYKYKNMHGY